MPSQFVPEYISGIVPPRLTLIRPAKSPVNKLQRQLLRRSSAGALLSYTLAAVYVSYVLIRVIDVFSLFSSGHGVLLDAEVAATDPAAAALSSDVDVSFARVAAAEQLEVAQADDSAWGATRADVGGLLWRLVVIAVEAVYGAAAVAWSAMATGAFSWGNNCNRCADGRARMHSAAAVGLRCGACGTWWGECAHPTDS